jgi:hypothetical protein
LILKPVKGRRVTAVLGNDAEENGAAVGVLLIAERADGVFAVTVRFHNTRACYQFTSRSG